MAGAGNRGLALWFAIGLAIVATRCGHQPPGKRVRLVEPPREAEPDASAAPQEILRVGIGSTLLPATEVRHYRDLVEYLGERLGIATDMVQRPNHSEMNELLRQRWCKLGLLCNYAFVRAQRDFGAEVLAAPVVKGELTYRAYLIAQKDGPVTSLLDLAGKRFAFEDPLCNAGWLYPSYRLVQLGHDPRTFFGSEIFTYSYENSIRAVADGSMDGAGVEAPIYDSLVAQGNPWALKTRIVERSQSMATPPIVVHPQLDPAIRRRLREFFLTLHESTRGRELLRKIRVDQFVEAEPALYAPVHDMAEAVERR